jgi:formylglycine-generating enzyme required for sulfatase activity
LDKERATVENNLKNAFLNTPLNKLDQFQREASSERERLDRAVEPFNKQVNQLFQEKAKILSSYMWSKENSNGATQPVGQKKPNPYGLYDMYGNVAEWLSDNMTKWPTDREIKDYSVTSAGGAAIYGNSVMDSTAYFPWIRLVSASKNDKPPATGFRLTFSLK